VMQRLNDQMRLKTGDFPLAASARASPQAPPP